MCGTSTTAFQVNQLSLCSFLFFSTNMQNDRTNKQVSTELSMSMFNFCKLFSLSSVFDVLKWLCHQNFPSTFVNSVPLLPLTLGNLIMPSRTPPVLCKWHMGKQPTYPSICVQRAHLFYTTPTKNQLFLRYRGLVNFQIQPLKCI